MRSVGAAQAKAWAAPFLKSGAQSIDLGSDCSSRRPVLDLQSRHGAQIAVLGDDGAVAQGERDRGQLHIDDRYDAARALEFVADAPKMLSRLVFERPFGDSGEP